MTHRLSRIPDPIWLLGLILLALAIRLGSIDFQSLWRDEVDALRFGRDLSAELGSALAGNGLDAMIKKLGETLTTPGFNGPLYFITLAQWSRAAGDSELSLRIFSAFFGILAIPLAYVLGKRLFQGAPHLGLLAAWLTAVSPYFVWYSQEAKMYTEITALALAAIYSLRRAVDAPGGQRTWPWWLLVVAATTLAMYSHILAALLIGVEVTLFALWWPQSKRHWRGGLIALAALTLPYLPLAVWQIGLAFTPGSQGHAFFRFDEMLRVMATGFAQGVLPLDIALDRIGLHLGASALSPATWGAWVLGALVIVGALLWKGAADRNHRIGLAAWAVLPIAIIALVSLNRPVFTDRYLIWIGPAVYLLAALGIGEVWKWRKVLGGIAFAAVTCVALVSVNAQATTPYKSDFRSAARYVQAHSVGNEGFLFQIPYGQFTFGYYFKAPFQAIDGPYTNHRQPDGSYVYDADYIDAGIANSLAGQKAVWLVASEVEMWDERHLLENWLSRHARITDRADFERVSVIRYELNP
jgi:hypothetical protein